MTKKFYPENEEEMLQKLKDEIIRVGLEKTPSRRKLVELYNRENIPHPLTYTNHFGTWDSIMKRIGLENNRINVATEEEYVYKTFQFVWEEHTEEFWLERLIEELCRVQLNENPSVTELRKVYDKMKLPSPSTYMKKFGSWENILKRIEKDPRIKRKTIRNRKRKNESIPRIKTNEDPYEHIFPNGPSKEVLINVMLDEMKTKKLYTRKDYEAKYNINVLPDMSIFTRATGLGWKDLWKIYVERFGDPIKQEREKYKSDLNLFLLD